MSGAGVGESEYPSRKTNRAQRQAIQRLFENLPDAFEDKFAAMLELRRAFHEELAAITGPALRRHVESHPLSTPKERKVLAAAVGERLFDLGLSLRCPLSNDLVYLTTDQERGVEDMPSQGQSPPGRFVLVHEQLGRRSATVVSDELPELIVSPGVDFPDEPPAFPWANPRPPRVRSR